MTERLEAEVTTCTPEEMFDALGYAWVQLFEEHPKRESLLCLLCQWALETGWGKACYAWNIGNFKSHDGDGRDWCFYKCDEIFAPDVAKKYLASAGTRADGQPGPNVVYKYTDKKGNICCWYYPDHPVSRFRAYHSIQAGAMDYLGSLHDRFNLAWPAILAGDPDQFIHQLAVQHYFTADEEQYRATTNKLFDQFKAKNFDMSSIPDLSERQKAQIQGLVALSLQQSFQGFEPTPNKNV